MDHQRASVAVDTLTEVVDNVDGDLAIDIAFDVASAEDGVDGAAVNIDRDIAVNVGALIRGSL